MSAHLDIPADLPAEDLIAAINDRLRRLAETQPKAGPPVPAQRGGSTSIIYLRPEGYYVLAAAGDGSVTPDLAHGPNQEITLGEGFTLRAPIGWTVSTTWTLFLLQDSEGGRAPAFLSTAYLAAAALAAMMNTAPNTYTSMDFVINAEGKSALSNIVTGVPTT